MFPVKVSSSMAEGGPTMARSTETLDCVRCGAEMIELSWKSLTAFPAGTTMSRIASLVMDADAESVDPPLATRRAPASLGREATERREQSMSSSSSRVGGWMLSRLEWQEEMEERSSAETLPTARSPSARRTATGTLLPSLPESVWRH